MLPLTINGRPVVAESGDTVYMAARKAGISIPSLCVSHQLAPFGSCRLCICEIDGQFGTLPPARLQSDPIWLSEPKAIGSGGTATISSNCIYLSSLKGARYPGHCASWRSHAASIECGISTEHIKDAPPCATTRTRSSLSTTQPASPAPAAYGPAMKFKARML